MRRRWLELIWFAGLLVGCRAPVDGGHTGDRTAAAGTSSSTIRAKQRVQIGETIGLELVVHNTGEEPLKVYPLAVSWIGKHERHRFMLRWTDMQGVEIRDPLGFTAGCDGPPGPRRRDSAKFVPAGESRTIEIERGECVTEVLATARPGRYRLWVEYGEPEVLRSNVVEIEILDGSPKSWACRDRQLQEAATIPWAQAQPIELLAIADGYLLVFEEEVRVGGMGETGSSSVWLQRLDLGLEPVGQPQRARGDLDFRLLDGHVTAAVADDRGLVLIVDEGRLEAYPLTLTAAELRLDSARTIEFSSYSIELAVVGSRFVGVSIDRGPVLSVFDHQGELEVTRRHLGDTGLFTIAPVADELLVISRDRGEQQPIVVTRFDAAGERVGVEFEFEIERLGRFAGASVDDGALNLAWLSNSHTPELLYRRFELDAADPVGSAAPAQRLHPAGIDVGSYSVVFDGSVPVVAWDYVDLGFSRGDVIVTAIARSVGVYPPRLAANVDTFALVWESSMSDRSLACQDLHHCVYELHGASIGRDGRVGAIRRLTKASQPRPYVPDSDEWRERCEASMK